MFNKKKTYFSRGYKEPTIRLGVWGIGLLGLSLMPLPNICKRSSQPTPDYAYVGSAENM
jgi:hypothetical protein